jgi:hypothetical protein
MVFDRRRFQIEDAGFNPNSTLYSLNEKAALSENIFSGLWLGTWVTVLNE